MKITIDTKEDSLEEIKQIIKMLSSLVGEKEVFTNAPQEKVSDAFSSIFGEQPKEVKEDKEEDVTSDIPQIIEY